MIKKAQTKFIIIIMSLMLGVFGVFFGASCYILNNVNEKNISNTLNKIESHYLLTKDVALPNCFVIEIIKLGPNPNDIAILYTKSHTSNITTEQIALIEDQALNNPYLSGAVNDICYKIHVKPDGAKIISATNVTDNMQIHKSNVLNVLIVLIVIYVLLFIFVFILSFTVFEPIKVAFFKQKQFISNASHELKTPLTIISANAEVLKQNGQNQWIESINSQTERMNCLVNDMLSLAKIDEAKEKLVNLPFNLSEVITNETLAFDALAFEKGKTLNIFIQSGIQYTGDVKSVINMVNILLDNAIKHATIGGEITLQLKKEGLKTTLTVMNTGSDIPDKDSNKIFERFYRGDSSRSRESGGSGLGLSIAKSIADNNKWKIHANSKYGQSMTITVIF